MSAGSPESRRFSRQVLVPEIGTEGQEKIRASRVLIVGAGGLGCPALLYLAASGVGTLGTGTLGIIDGDRVEESNLGRQVLYGTPHLGRPKAETAKTELMGLHPDIAIEAWTEFLTPDNAVSIFEKYDLILDGTDTVRAKALINSAAGRTGKPVVFASVTGMEGQIFLSRPGLTPCYRCVFPSLREGGNCDSLGVLGPVAGLMGSLQAAESLKWLARDLSARAPGVGVLFRWDARTLDTLRFKVDLRPGCPACDAGPGRFAFPESARNAAGSECGMKPVPHGFPPENHLPEALLRIDVREYEERLLDPRPGSLHLPLSGLLAGACLPPENARKLLLFCRTGVRARKARKFLLSRGWSDVEVLEDRQ